MVVSLRDSVASESGMCLCFRLGVLCPTILDTQVHPVSYADVGGLLTELVL